jgi:glutaminyl-peptide cyclotransferase
MQIPKEPQMNADGKRPPMTQIRIYSVLGLVQGLGKGLRRAALSGVQTRHDPKGICVHLRSSAAVPLSATSVVWLLLSGSAAMSFSTQSVVRPVEQLRVEVIRSYPHDRAAFTQGLVLDGGTLYESTGLVGRSSLRAVELATGRVIKKVDVPPPVFAEGLALAGETLFQLSWQTNRVFTYNRKTFAREAEYSYQGEGWGLCYNGKELVMSNGSDELAFRRPSDFGVIRTVRVTLDGTPLKALNELECVAGSIYANVWMQDLIVRIDPASGKVTARIDAANLLSPLERKGVDVLNGIAYDAADKTFLITGKLWPKLFRVKFVK